MVIFNRKREKLIQRFRGNGTGTISSTFSVKVDEKWKMEFFNRMIRDSMGISYLDVIGYVQLNHPLKNMFKDTILVFIILYNKNTICFLNTYLIKVGSEWMGGRGVFLKSQMELGIRLLVDTQ